MKPFTTTREHQLESSYHGGVSWIMNVMNAMVGCHENKNSDLQTWSGNSGISNFAYKMLLFIKITVKIIKEKNHLSKKTV